MLSAEFLAMLRCPENHSSLSMGDSTLAARLNEAVSAGRLKNRAGQRVEKRLDGVLLRADGQVAYPIIDEIPILLVDEGILVSEI
jgi:uncharacterized protein YbaR (Trm112 family)